MLNIVILNGGRGAASIIPRLATFEGVSITSIVNAYDDGKSTGEIRRFFQMLGPSDIRKVQELLLPKSDPNYLEHIKLFQYRFPPDCDRMGAIKDLNNFIKGDSDVLLGVVLADEKVRVQIKKFIKAFLKNFLLIEKAIDERFNFSDCSLMNCIYAGAFIVCKRNIEETTLNIEKLFSLNGSVLPNSIENKILMGMRENGEVLYSEAEIVELRSNALIEKIFLLDRPPNKVSFECLSIEDKRSYLKNHHSFVGASKHVLLALKSADIIIYSAGTQHSSLYPTYLSSGIPEMIANSSAYKIFITNIGADYETPFYKASDYINGAFRYLTMSSNRKYSMMDFFHLNIINNSNIKGVDSYVEYDAESFREAPYEYLLGDFESRQSPGKHDGDKLIATILSCYQSYSTLSSL